LKTGDRITWGSLAGEVTYIDTYASRVQFDGAPSELWVNNHELKPDRVVVGYGTKLQRGGENYIVVQAGIVDGFATEARVINLNTGVRANNSYLDKVGGGRFYAPEGFEVKK
jgi:hypothetical protein